MKTALPVDLLRKILTHAVVSLKEVFESPDATDEENVTARREILAWLMDLAKVSRAFADVMLDRSLWAPLVSKLWTTDLPLASGLGLRWNRFFNECAREDKDGHLLSYNYFSFVPLRIDGELARTQEMVHRAALSICHRRTYFELVVEVDMYGEKSSDAWQQVRGDFYESWRRLGAVLSFGCESLTVFHRTEIETESRRTVIGIYNLCHWVWPKLQQLRMGMVYGDTIRSIDARARLLPLQSEHDDGNDGPPLPVPFPALQMLEFYIPHNACPVRDVLYLAPRLTECRMASLGFRGSVEFDHEWLNHVECFAPRIFMEKDMNFRTYISPGSMLAFKSPGPNSIEKYLRTLRARASKLNMWNHGVVVSERSNGVIYDKHMSFEELHSCDLHSIKLPGSQLQF